MTTIKKAGHSGDETDKQIPLSSSDMQDANESDEDDDAENEDLSEEEKSVLERLLKRLVETE